MSKKPKAINADPDGNHPAGSASTDDGKKQRPGKKTIRRKRGDNEGTIFLPTWKDGRGKVHKGKTWQMKVVVNGKAHTRSTGTTVKSEAEAALADFVKTYRDNGEARDRLEVIERLTREAQDVRDRLPSMKISQAWSAYLNATNRPDAGADTLRMYGYQFGKFEKWIGEAHPDAVELRNVSSKIADEFAAKIGAELSPNSFNKYITLFRCVWETLKETARLTVNPWDKIRHKVLVTHIRRELTLEELARVCGSLDGEMRLLFAIGIYTGLRLGDCALLTWGNVDRVRGVVSVVPRKTKRHTGAKSVIIPLHKTLAAMLDETPEDRRGGYVMPEIAELYARDAGGLSRRIQRIFEKCGITTQAEKENGVRARVDVGFHSLRHTYVSMCANAGVPLALVQSIVGHTNPAMTLHYFHQSDAALKTAVAALPDLSTADNAKAGDAAKPDALYQTFCEIVAKMDAAQLDRARKHLAGIVPGAK